MEVTLRILVRVFDRVVQFIEHGLPHLLLKRLKYTLMAAHLSPQRDQAYPSGLCIPHPFRPGSLDLIFPLTQYMGIQTHICLIWYSTSYLILTGL